MIRFSCIAIFALAGLAACTNPGHTGPSGQDPYAFQTRGCIDKDFTACYNNLGATVAIDETHVSPPLDEVKKTDIDGKTVYADKVELQAYIPAPVQLVVFQVYTDSSTGVIGSVDATMSTDLFHVVSSDDFHKVGLFPVLSAVLGSECPSLTEAQLAQTYYDQMKPEIVTDEEAPQHKRTLLNDTHRQHVPPFHLCGRDILISMKWGTDSKKVTDDNQHGDYAFTFVAVK